MGKRDSGNWDENKYNKFIKEGRGQGEGKDYKPWLTVQDFPSMGRASRIFGWKTQRIHHFFTDAEMRFFYLLEWEDNNAIVDIREHFPLFNMEEILENKKGINFDHFKDKNSGTQYVICTSFLITIKNSLGNKSYVARSLKSSSELEKRTALERLEIERRYWSVKGIDWGIVTQKDIPLVRAKNIEWIHSALTDENEFEVDGVKELEDALMERVAENPKPMRTLIMDFDKDYTLEGGTGLYVFKRLIANKKIKVDMDKRINLNLPAVELIDNGHEERSEKYAIGS